MSEQFHNTANDFANTAVRGLKNHNGVRYNRFVWKSSLAICMGSILLALGFEDAWYTFWHGLADGIGWTGRLLAFGYDIFAGPVGVEPSVENMVVEEEPPYTPSEVIEALANCDHSVTTDECIDAFLESKGLKK